MRKITQWESEVRKIRKMRKCSDKQARRILRNMERKAIIEEGIKFLNANAEDDSKILVDFVKGEAVNKPLT